MPLFGRYWPLIRGPPKGTLSYQAMYSPFDPDVPSLTLIVCALCY